MGAADSFFYIKVTTETTITDVNLAHFLFNYRYTNKENDIMQLGQTTFLFLQRPTSRLTVMEVSLDVMNVKLGAQ